MRLRSESVRVDLSQVWTETLHTLAGGHVFCNLVLKVSLYASDILYAQMACLLQTAWTPQTACMRQTACVPQTKHDEKPFDSKVQCF